jgi:hypothetical protein
MRVDVLVGFFIPMPGGSSEDDKPLAVVWSSTTDFDSTVVVVVDGAVVVGCVVEFESKSLQSSMDRPHRPGILFNE